MEYIAIITGSIIAFVVSVAKETLIHTKKDSKPKAAYAAPDFSEDNGKGKIIK